MNVGSDRIVSDAAAFTNVRYLEGGLKPSTTNRILNEVFGSLNWSELGLCRKRMFLAMRL